MSCENTNSVFINASDEIKELIFKISKSTIKKEKIKAFFSYWTFTCVSYYAAHETPSPSFPNISFSASCEILMIY